MRRDLFRRIDPDDPTFKPPVKHEISEGAWSFLGLCFGVGDDEKMAERIPAGAFHISEMLQEEMDARGWTRQTVYERLGYDKVDCLAFDLLMDVKDKNLLMGAREAQALSDAFGIDDPGFFIRMHEAWRTHPSTQAMEETNVMTKGAR